MCMVLMFQIYWSGSCFYFTRVGSDARIKSLGDTFVNVLSEADICFRNRFIFPIHGPLSQILLIFYLQLNKWGWGPFGI